VESRPVAEPRAALGGEDEFVVAGLRALPQPPEVVGDDEHVDDRERQVLRNEALFREVNERIEDVSEDVSRADFIEFLWTQDR
jgi:hypothetical protein